MSALTFPLKIPPYLLIMLFKKDNKPVYPVMAVFENNLIGVQLGWWLKAAVSASRSGSGASEKRTLFCSKASGQKGRLIINYH